MRSFQIALALLLAVTLCSSAHAFRIDTTADGDGLYEVLYDTNDNINSESITGLSDSMLEMQYYLLPSYYECETHAVVVFSLQSLQGVSLQPGSVSLNTHFLAVSGDGNVECYHVGGNYGSSVDLAYAQADSTTYIGDVPVWGFDPVWVSTDVTDQIQADIDQGFSYSAFSFRVYDWEISYPQQAWSGISAFESGNGAYLTVNAVPEPASIAALLTGLCGCGFFLKRRVK